MKSEKKYVKREAHIYKVGQLFGFINDRSMCGKVVWSLRWDDCTCITCKSHYTPCDECNRLEIMLELAE